MKQKVVGSIWGMVFVLLSIPWFFMAWLLAARWDFLLQWLGAEEYHLYTVISLTGLGSAAFIAGLCYWSYVFSSSEKRNRKRSIQCPTDMGHVQISLEVIKSLTLRASRRIRGVQGVTAHVALPVVEGEPVMCIDLWVTVDGERSLPDLTEELQKAVKERIERIAGVIVSHVSVDVTKTAAVERVAMRVG